MTIDEAREAIDELLRPLMPDHVPTPHIVDDIMEIIEKVRREDFINQTDVADNE